MNREQLMTALARHDADPGAVMAAFRAKRRRRARNRSLTVCGGLAAVGIVVATAVLHPWASAPRPAAVGRQSGPPHSSPASGCASVSMSATLATARRSGASVIVAVGSLAGRTGVSQGQVYYQMLLRSVRTLIGPPIASGSTGWIGSTRGPAGPIPGADAGALWGADGRLFAVVWPARLTGTTVGPVLHVAPVAGSRVIFSSAGCWDSAGLPSKPYHGRLMEIPGSKSYLRAAAGGFHAVPLTIIERLVASAAHHA